MAHGIRKWCDWAGTWNSYKSYLNNRSALHPELLNTFNEQEPEEEKLIVNDEQEVLDF